MKHALLVLAALTFGLPALADGVDVGKPSSVRNLVPAGAIEQQAVQQYEQLKRQASAKDALGPADHPQVIRLRAIAARMIPFVERFNPRARHWKWEVNLIGSKQINAFCMPGGKIAFYSGILDTLKLTDDEAAMVMGHEIAHALREHARERMAKSQITQLGANLLGELVGGGRYAGAFQIGGNLLSLKFSRDDESEADVVGLDIAARAGFDPRAGVSLWQKMTAANSRAPLEFLSTHPAGDHRIREIEKHLPEVMPLYRRAISAKPGASAVGARDSVRN
ncbi:MAG: M48 family metallopeptidase [Sulfuritalea sp.]|nr:M48 family metallopeptidase [Sulfuritalea sp.]